MNTKFHKLQAEELIKQANRVKEAQNPYWSDWFDRYVALAQVHATLALVGDDE